MNGLGIGEWIQDTNQKYVCEFINEGVTPSPCHPFASIFRFAFISSESRSRTTHPCNLTAKTLLSVGITAGEAE